MKRYLRRTDQNQKDIVEGLRRLGFSVYLDVDDILVGCNGKNYWYEIKKPETVSKRTGKVNDSAKKEGQKKLEKEWQGHYRIVSSLDEILEDIKNG